MLSAHLRYLSDSPQILLLVLPRTTTMTERPLYDPQEMRHLPAALV